MGGWPSGSAVEEVSAGSDGVCMCVLGGGLADIVMAFLQVCVCCVCAVCVVVFVLCVYVVVFVLCVLSAL